MGERDLVEEQGAAGQTDARSNEDLTEAAADGLRWIAYARIAAEVLLMGSMVLLARMIPPAAFGIFAVITIVQELALTMPMEGVGGALVQRDSITRKHLQGGFALNIAVSLVLIGLTALAAILIVRPLLGEETARLAILASPVFLLGAIYAIPYAVLRRRLDFRRISLLDIVTNATRALASVALAVAGLDAPALVFGSMAGLAAATGLALLFARVPLPRWRGRAIRDLLPYGGPAGLATIAWAGFRNGDYVVIGAVLGPASAGFYWRAYQLAVEYQSKIASVMTQIAFPVLARTAGGDELQALRQRMVQLLTVAVFPILATLLIVAPVAIPWLFGPAWEPTVVPTQILVLGGAATMTINACGSALMAAGRARTLLGYGIAHFVVYVGSVLIVAKFGLIAVAIAGSVVHTIFLGVAYDVMLRGRADRPLRVLWHDLMPATTASFALVALAWPTGQGLAAIGAPVLVQLSGIGLAGMVGYLAALRIWFPASAHDLFAAVRRIVPKRLMLNRARQPAFAGS
jgi:O-antigen/teichoic acid export membrane protein